MSESELMDLTVSSKATGEPLGTAVARHVGIEEFSALMTRLETEHPDVLVRYGLPKPGTTGPNWVIVTNRPSNDFMKDLTTLPTDTVVRIGAPFGIEDNAKVVSAALTGLREMSGSGVSGYSTYDLDEMHPVVHAVAEDGATAKSVDMAEAIEHGWRSAEGAIGTKLPTGSIRFEVETGVHATPTATVRGGRSLTSSGGGLLCTAGFTGLRNVTGNLGVITAQHCPNNMLYTGLANVIDYGAAASNAGSSMVDLQFHRVVPGYGHIVTPEFFATSNTTAGQRAVTSVANAPIYSTVCNYGQTTGYNCAVVYHLDECGGGYCGLDLRYPSYYEPGDSGGPNFENTTARGITSGFFWTDDNHNGVFDDPSERNWDALTRIGRAANYMDTTVLQN